MTLSAGVASPAGAAGERNQRILAVGAENEYANVIAQIGGRYVETTAIMSNPNTDPHTFEASPRVAETVSTAALVVQNGLGYDTFMNRIESAAPNAKRKIIEVQQLLGLSDTTPNPHLWYSPKTMPAVAQAVAGDLAAIEPAHTAYFRQNAAHFVRSLKPWLAAIAGFRSHHLGVGVAVTEPVGDYLLTALGAHIATPWSLQADIMNGVDPAPQDVTLEENLFTSHAVKVFVYNRQVTDSLTETFLADAQRAGIPVVGVYETMPAPGYSYQSWMVAEVEALARAIVDRTSTSSL